MGTRRYEWGGVDDPSRTDSVQVAFAPGGMRASGSSFTETYATGWTLDVDELWRTRRIDVVASGRGWSRHLCLVRSATGAWTSEAAALGQSALASPGIVPGADLGGALDCDLGLCPLTNVMPVRRLGLLAGSVPDTPLVMAWIEVPSLRVLRSDQVYGSGSAPGLVRYTSRSRDVRTELEVDDDGVVVDYPGLARRQGDRSR